MSNRPLAPSKIEYNDCYVLRPVEPTDIPEIERARTLSINELHVYMDWSHQTFEKEYLLQRVLAQWASYFRGDEYEMALFDKNGLFLVYTGFYPTARLNPRCFEIGYWASSEHKGKGYTTLATQLQICLLFEYFKADRIEINCSVENKASLRVIEKCGFCYEGEMRNFYPEGTEQMHAAGYVQNRRVALYSLIPEDRSKLFWYQDIVSKIKVYPLLEVPFYL